MYTCVTVRDPINRFNTTTMACLSQATTWNSNVIYRGPVFIFNELRLEVVFRCVDNDGIVGVFSIYKGMQLPPSSQ